MYTISQVSEKFNIPISTLRFYDKQGLIPNLKRENGIRKFSEENLESLRIIEYLKASGLEIKEIKKYFDLVRYGESTYNERKEIFESRKQVVEEEMENLKRVMDLLNYKIWYYETAISDGNEEHLKEIIPDKLPEDIKQIYNNFHIE